MNDNNINTNDKAIASDEIEQAVGGGPSFGGGMSSPYRKRAIRCPQCKKILGYLPKSYYPPQEYMYCTDCGINVCALGNTVKVNEDGTFTEVD
jgi:hypothetical protein